MAEEPKVLKDDLILYDSPFFENTAKILPPNAVAPMGRIVLNLGQPRDQAGLVTRDLLDASGDFAESAPANKVPYPLDPATQSNATDNQIIRLQDGSLLASKNGYTWSDVTPRPEWFDTGSFQYGTNLFSPRARNAVYLFCSTDGGQSWELWSVIDSAVVAEGKYGWPQPNKGPTGFGIGGFDRTELYQDPWTGAIFVSGHGDGGPYILNGKTTESHAGVIFRSLDDGKSWDTLHTLDGSPPYLMTSTPDHRLIVFHIRNNVPTLYYREAGVMSAPKDVTASEGKSLLAWGEDAELGDITGGLHQCLARVGKYGSWDRVWIAYPSLNASGRQTYAVATVTFGGTAEAKVELIAKVAAEDPKTTSATMGNFVSDDLVDPDNQNTDASCTLFYWVEAQPSTSTDPDKTKVLVRYQIFHSGQPWPPGYLSVQNGSKRYFGRSGIGDYFSGGYFWMNGELNFLAQWKEPDAIKGNIVSLPPSTPIKVNIYREFLELIILPHPDPALRELIEASLRGFSIAQRRGLARTLERIQGYVNEGLGDLTESGVDRTEIERAGKRR
jgi:hypothetical protein